METGYKINGEDIGTKVEYSRDIATDPESPFASRGYSNQGKSFPLANVSIFGGSGWPGTGVDISDYYKSSLGSFPLLMEKGCRPRLNKNLLTFGKFFKGTSQRKYYYMSRTEEKLYIFESYSKDNGYTCVYESTLNTNETFEMIDFDFYRANFNGIPKYIYAELVGSGGGGSSGLWVDDNDIGGSGGSGGGIAYTIFPVGAYRSNYATRDTSTDFYFEVQSGGVGSSGTIFIKTTDGKNGNDTTAYSPDGSVFAYGVKGRGGDASSFSYTEPYAQNSPNTLFQIAGGRGGPGYASGDDVIVPSSAVFLEAMNSHWTKSYGGSASPLAALNGGGGGGSRGDGGYGGGHSSRSGPLYLPSPGGIGGGGGGGTGGGTLLKHSDCKTGAAGGPGAISFFY